MAIFVYPRWPSAAILDFVEPQIAPFDLPTPKTLAYSQTWSGSYALFARYSLLNYIVTLNLGFGVTQGYQKWHHLVEHIDFIFVFHSNYASIYYRFRDIAAFWSKIATPLVFSTPIRGDESVRFMQRRLVMKN